MSERAPGYMQQVFTYTQLLLYRPCDDSVSKRHDLPFPGIYNLCVPVYCKCKVGITEA